MSLMCPRLCMCVRAHVRVCACANTCLYHHSYKPGGVKHTWDRIPVLSLISCVTSENPQLSHPLFPEISNEDNKD